MNMRSRFGVALLLILWTSLSCIGFPQQSGGVFQFKCPSDCFCSSFSDHEIQCPMYDPLVRVDFKPPDSAKLTCMSVEQSVYERVPNIALGEIRQFRLQNCPLPHEDSLASIPKRLNITKVRGLEYIATHLQHDVSFRKKHFAGFNGLERLQITDSIENQFSSDMFDELEALQWLHIKSNRENLPSHIFSKLTNLTVLELMMKLRRVEPGLFASQERLRKLTIWGNQIRVLQSDAFRDIINVSEMDLSANKIEVLEPGVFQTLPRLEHLRLSNNNFSTLPPNLFANNTALQEFRLEHNHSPLEELPAGMMAHLPSLTRLTIQALVVSVPEDLLAGSRNLTIINFEKNRLKYLPPRLLQDQENLEELNLQYNLLQQLEDGLFQNTRALRVLRLSNNQLFNVSANLFGQLTRLETLYLDHNNLIYIHPEAFSAGRDRLITLELQFNHLSFSDGAVNLPNFSETDILPAKTPFNALQKLRYLNLQHNKVESFSFSIDLYNLLDLQHLDLSHNAITYLEVSGDLTFLQQNLTVNFTNNQISEIDFGNYASLEGSSGQTSNTVLLGNNPLNCDCVTMYLVQALKNPAKLSKYVNLDVSGLQCARPMNLYGQNVVDLDPYLLLCPLPKTPQDHCPSECSCQVRLVDKAILVDCAGKNLTSVPTLPDPKTYNMDHMELDLSGNFLSELPTIRNSGYSRVSVLRTNENRIARLYADNLPEKLRELYLDNNALEALNDSVISQLNASETLQHLSLSANPWSCDCSSVNFLTFAQTNFRKLKDFSKVECSDARKISVLSAGDFCPKDNLPLILGCIMLALFGILVAICAVLYMKYSQEIKVYLFAKGWLMWLVSEDDLDQDKIYDAFVSYSSLDKEFVVKNLVQELETGEFPYKLCVHERDWMPGDTIAEQVLRSVEQSRKTIVLLSPNFLQSIWGKAEFRAAHESAMREGRAKVILIIYGDIGDTENLDEELKSYVKTNTYLQWDDQWFMRKLRYALRHPISMRRSQEGRGLMRSAMKNSVDDRLELIMPSPVTPTLTTPPAESANNSLAHQLTNGGNQKYHNGNGHVPNGRMANGNGINGHVNGAFIINTNAKQSDV